MAACSPASNPGDWVIGGNICEVIEAFRPPSLSSLHRNLPLPYSSYFSPFPFKIIFLSLSLAWATAGAFHISVQLASFLALFLPRVSIQRVVHPDILPWLALHPDSADVRAK